MVPPPTRRREPPGRARRRRPYTALSGAKDELRLSIGSESYTALWDAGGVSLPGGGVVRVAVDLSIRAVWYRRRGKTRMSGSFRVKALPAERFASWWSLDDEELRARGARRITVDETPGYPCRVSLADAEVGERVLLVPFVHHDVASPYRASGPVFVRPGAPTATPAVGEVPVMLRHRLLSVRAYDAEAMLVGAEVLRGGELDRAIAELFSRNEIRYLHVHNAGPGCFNCSVVRARAGVSAGEL